MLRVKGWLAIYSRLWSGVRLRSGYAKSAAVLFLHLAHSSSGPLTQHLPTSVPSSSAPSAAESVDGGTTSVGTSVVTKRLSRLVQRVSKRVLHGFKRVKFVVVGRVIGIM